MAETLIFLVLVVLACWVGYKLPAPGTDTADLIARVIKQIQRRL